MSDDRQDARINLGDDTEPHLVTIEQLEIGVQIGWDERLTALYVPPERQRELAEALLTDGARVVHHSWLCDVRRVVRDGERGMTRTAVLGYLTELLDDAGGCDDKETAR